MRRISKGNNACKLRPTNKSVPGTQLEETTIFELEDGSGMVTGKS